MLSNRSSCANARERSNTANISMDKAETSDMTSLKLCFGSRAKSTQFFSIHQLHPITYTSGNKDNRTQYMNNQYSSRFYYNSVVLVGNTTPLSRRARPWACLQQHQFSRVASWGVLRYNSDHCKRLQLCDDIVQLTHHYGTTCICNRVQKTIFPKLS